MSGTRRLSAGLLVAAGLCSGGGLALGATAAPPRAYLTGFACVSALDPIDRSLSLKATMYPLAGQPGHFAMLPLLMRRRTGGSMYRPVAAGSLGRWIRPADPTLGEHPGDVWILNLPVVDLSGPADYRMSVRFHWLDRRGRLLVARTEQSPVCHQPELRPDLAVGPVRATSAGPGHEQYAVHVSNLGATAAGRFIVRLIQGSTVSEQPVDGLAAHATAVVRLTGTRCDPAAPPRVIVDPQALVDDANRANNSLTVACR